MKENLGESFGSYSYRKLVRVTVCRTHRRPLCVTVRYQDYLWELNQSAVLIAGRFNHSWPGLVVGVQAAG